MIIAAAPDLAPVIPVVTAIGVVVLTAIVGLIVARLVKPTEWMEENRKTRAELTSLRTDFESFRDKSERETRIYSRGFDSAWWVVERMREHWGESDMPPIPEAHTANIAAARHLLDGLP